MVYHNVKGEIISINEKVHKISKRISLMKEEVSKFLSVDTSSGEKSMNPFRSKIKCKI